MKTTDLVIFRRFPAGDVIALFPLIPATNDGWDCQSYQHIGQHGSADVGLVRETSPAKRVEWLPLARELRSIGYKLKIGSRVPRNAYDVRKAQLKP